MSDDRTRSKTLVDYKLGGLIGALLVSLHRKGQTSRESLCSLQSLCLA